jgi:hypothetical protein
MAINSTIPCSPGRREQRRLRRATLLISGWISLASLICGQSPALTHDEALPTRNVTLSQNVQHVVVVPDSTNAGGVPAQAAPASVVFTQNQDVALYRVSGDATSTDSATDNGGFRISKAALQIIFWGSFWQTATAPSSSDIFGAVQSVVDGPYLSQLSQYGFEGLSLGPPLVITSSNPPMAFTDSDVSGFVSGLIRNGTVPSGRILLCRDDATGGHFPTGWR